MKKLLLVATIGVAGIMSASVGNKELKVDIKKIDIKKTEQASTCTRCVRSTTYYSDGTSSTVQYCYEVKCYELTLNN